MAKGMADFLLLWFSPNGVIAIGVLYGIWRMMVITREARLARQANIAAAQEGVAHARATSAAVAVIAHDMKALEENTNSKMDKLLAAKDETARAQVGEATAVGIATGVAQERDRT